MSANQNNHHDEHHIMPLATYYKVAGALFFLTFLTVGFHAIHEYLGPFAALIAFAIAAVKAFLVMAWFMHLKYENTSNRMIFGAGFIFLLLLFTLCILDIYTRFSVGSVL
jgi:cytochrome c oxidase subunit 4